MDKILVVLVSILLVGLIIWWFFGKKKSNHVASEINSDNIQRVEITVDGGYKPNVVELKQGVPAEIIFNRKDPSNCLSEVVMPDFGVNQSLPHNQKSTIDIDTSKSGEFQYSCGMHMFHGKLVIK